MAGTSASSRPQTWQLPTALQLHILSLLPPNEGTLSSRFVCQEVCDALSEPQHCTASLSQPLPPHAAPWAIDAGQRHVRQLPFLQKFQLLCTAATSGSEVNLEVAWAVLEPSVFPEQLQERDAFWADQMALGDPGVAAVKAGCPQLLGWLQSRCPALLRPGGILSAAAQHCDLAGLQAAWEALDGAPIRCRDSGSLHQVLLDAAAGSKGPDAVAKVQWALTMGEGACHPTGSTAVSAALSGDPARLRWLLEHGYEPPVDEHGGAAVVPCRAMEQGSLGAVQWLVDEAGFRLPGGHGTVAWVQWKLLLQSAGKSPDGVAKLRWLQERGAPQLAADMQLLQGVALDATKAGQVEVLRYLLLVSGPEAVLLVGWHWLAQAAAGSGSIATATLLQQLGVVFEYWAYQRAADSGSVDMVRWLSTEAGVQPSGRTLQEVVRAWPNRSRRDSGCLLQAVRQLVGAGCRSSDPAVLLSYAASRGDLTLLQYLQEQQPWQQQAQQQGQQKKAQAFWRWKGGEAILHATQGGCEAVLEWLAENGGDLSYQGAASPWLVAGKHGDRGTLAALRRLGVPWDHPDLLMRAVNYGCCMPAVRWLAGQGAPVGSRGAMEMVVGSQTRVDAMWLLELAGPAEPDAGDAVIDLT